MEKRKPAEMNEVRNGFYGAINADQFPGHEFVGMSAEGAVFVNADGKYAVVKVIAKANEFDGKEAVAEFEAKQVENAKKEEERAAKKAEKEERARKRAEEKAAKEAEAESAE